jgi:putative membrane protein
VIRPPGAAARLRAGRRRPAPALRQLLQWAAVRLRATTLVLAGALAWPATAQAHGDGAAGGGSPWVWTLEPRQLVPIAVVALLYARRAARLRRRGQGVPAAYQASFYTGLALVVVALVSPIDWIGEERLFAVHMTQHLLLGDLAPLLVVIGLTGPVLRPVLALPLLGRLRLLAHPLVALPLWAANLYLWHLPSLYQEALANDWVHALQHACFFAFGALMWAALIEPLPGPRWFGNGWKALYVLAVRLLGTLLANVLMWSGSVFYPRYAEEPRLWGISPLEDQSLGGVVMMVEGSVVTILVFAWLFFRWASDSEERQRLADQGLSARGGRARRPLTPGPPLPGAVQAGLEGPAQPEAPLAPGPADGRRPLAAPPPRER